MFDSFRGAVMRARLHGDLYFAALLDQQDILEAFGPARSLWQGWIYTPAVTMWVFLSQCLSPDHSCRDAVARLSAWHVAQGRRPCSPDTGAYCAARDALPETACHQLVRRTGRELEAQSPTEWLWHARRVRVVDGSTITMPDTPENQAEYPQAKTQKRGCGLPIARILVIFSLATGAVLEAAIGRYKGKKTGENSLFRTLHDVLEAGDVVLADRHFSGWFDIALLAQRGVDVMLRKHQKRVTDFRTGQRLGSDDHLVRWRKPPRPKWMSIEQYAALPDELLLRELRVHVKQRGFRSKIVVVVTTLVDAQEIPADEIAELYRRRWQAELQLRSLKVVLQMDHLRCKQPHRVRNEFYMHLLAYNLIRRVMLLAAVDNKVPPWQISFKGTLQNLNNFLPLLVRCMSLEAGCAALFNSVAAHTVGNRPDRYEPRCIKRRPKPHKWMQMSRQEYKTRMK
jgi:Transposase DDE domain